MIDTVLFDLDGTLLPMEQEVFTEAYFKALSEKFADRHNPKDMVDAVWKGTGAMIQNDGKQTNEDVFWNVYSSTFGKTAEEDKPIFDTFYANEFNGLQSVCESNPQAIETIKTFKQEGLRLIIASNPVFPMQAQKARMEWAGMIVSDFEYITSYENSSYCKPNLKYYEEILQKAHCAAKRCLMVGNDTKEDMVAASVGMKVFLLTNCLINKERKDISKYPRGNFSQLLYYIEQNK